MVLTGFPGEISNCTPSPVHGAKDIQGTLSFAKSDSGFSEASSEKKLLPTKQG